MSKAKKGTIHTDNRKIKALSDMVRLGKQLPPGSDLHALSHSFDGLPTLPDRFNDAFVKHGWVFLKSACSCEAAEAALKMLQAGDDQRNIDEMLAERFLIMEPIKHQAIKLMGGSVLDPPNPVRAAITERVFQAYENADYLAAIPLILMLVDSYGITATGSKSIFSDLIYLEDLFQSPNSVAGHPSALRRLLGYLCKGQKGYNEIEINIPYRNGILHGARLNYANPIAAAKAVNLLAAVVEWARDTTVYINDPKRRDWNINFLSQYFKRHAPRSPDDALTLFQEALTNHRPADLTALVDYDPVITLLKEKIDEWHELKAFEIKINRLSEWQIIGTDEDDEQDAICEIHLSVRASDGRENSIDRKLYTVRSARLSEVGLKSVWQLRLDILGAIRNLIVSTS